MTPSLVAFDMNMSGLPEAAAIDSICATKFKRFNKHGKNESNFY